MSISNVGPTFAPFMMLSMLIPIVVLVLAVYLIVCIHQIKNSTQEAAQELKEIRRLLSEHTKRD